MFNMNLSYLKKLNSIIGEEIYPGQVIKVIDNSDGKYTHLLMDHPISVTPQRSSSPSKTPKATSETFFLDMKSIDSSPRKLTSPQGIKEPITHEDLKGVYEKMQGNSKLLTYQMTISRLKKGLSRRLMNYIQTGVNC